MKRAKPLDTRIRAGSTVDPATNCWIWKGAHRPDGYVQIRVANRLVYAHRISYEVFVGPIPEGLTLDHLCRVRACVNPEHLEPVTLRENIRRGESESAKNARKAHCKRGHPLSRENLIVESNGRRKCRTCARARDAVRRQAEGRKKYMREYMRAYRRRS